MAYINQGCVQNKSNHQAITVSFRLCHQSSALRGFIDSSLKELKAEWDCFPKYALVAIK